MTAVREQEAVTRTLVGRPDYFLFACFVLLWLVPMSYVGLTHHRIPAVGRYLNNLYRVSALFTKRTHTWSEFYCEMRLCGESTWSEVPVDSFSPMKVFGGRSRFFFVMMNSFRDPRGTIQRQRLAQFVRKRLASQQWDPSEIAEIRFVSVTVPSGERLASQPGPWKTWQLEHVPVHARRVVSSHKFSIGVESEAESTMNAPHRSWTLQSASGPQTQHVSPEKVHHHSERIHSVDEVSQPTPSSRTRRSVLVDSLAPTRATKGS